MSFFPSNNDKILIDSVGKYSITLPDKTQIITNLIEKYMGTNDITITDAMACVGGDTLTFSKTFKSVNACELDKTRFEYLKHNMEIFEQKNINFINDDYLNIYHKLTQDVIYIDPPWGGPEYKTKSSIKIKLGEKKLEEICDDIIQKKLCKLLVLKLPYNYNLNELKFYTHYINVLKNIVIISIPISNSEI
jgi:16S rRNA G966 N2-methylase RsmD